MTLTELLQLEDTLYESYQSLSEKKDKEILELIYFIEQKEQKELERKKPQEALELMNELAGLASRALEDNSTLGYLCEGKFQAMAVKRLLFQLETKILNDQLIMQAMATDEYQNLETYFLNNARFLPIDFIKLENGNSVISAYNFTIEQMEMQHYIELDLVERFAFRMKENNPSLFYDLAYLYPEEPFRSDWQSHNFNGIGIDLISNSFFQKTAESLEDLQNENYELTSAHLVLTLSALLQKQEQNFPSTLAYVDSATASFAPYQLAHLQDMLPHELYNFGINADTLEHSPCYQEITKALQKRRLTHDVHKSLYKR